MRKFTLLLAAMIVVSCAATSGQDYEAFTVAETRSVVTMPKEGVKRALLIATGDYLYNESITNLKSVDSDVDMIRDQLIDPHCGFKEENIVVLKSNDKPRLDKIAKQIQDFLDSCGSNDFVLIYFAGHGFHDPLTGADYYVPFDAKPLDADNSRLDPSTCYSFDALKKSIEGCSAKFKWVVVDACRSNFNTLDVNESWNTTGKITAAEGSLWFQSCSPEQKSYTVDRHIENDFVKCGLFTMYFCKGVEGAAADDDGLITPMGLFRYVRRNVTKAYDERRIEDRQTPLCDYKDFSGEDFVFVDRSDESASKAYKDACDCYDAGNYEQALSKIERALSLKSTEQKYQDKKTQITAWIAYKKACKDYENKNYQSAKTSIDEALTLAPNEPTFQEKKKQIEAWVAYGSAFFSFGVNDLENAQQKINKALEYEPENDTFKKLQTQIEVRKLLKQGWKDLWEGKKEEALNRANRALELDSNNTEALTLKEVASRSGDLPIDLDLNGAEYRLIKAGYFTMGSPLSREEVVKKYPTSGKVEWFNNAPQHKVTLTQDFYLAKYPVTRGEFKRFVEATDYKTTAEKEGSAYCMAKDGNWEYVDGASWKDPGFEQTDSHPVVCVSYDDALAYIAWLNKSSKPEDELNGLKPTYRLPTEAEWEYACRAGTKTEFFWGDDEKDGKGYLNGAGKEKAPNGGNWNYSFSFDDGYSATSPVGSFNKNPWGLFDMLGNVWEWTSDWYGDYSNGSVKDPKGATSCSYRVLRGGSWGCAPALCRCAYRCYGAPEWRGAYDGMRVAFSLTK